MPSPKQELRDLLGELDDYASRMSNVDHGLDVRSPEDKKLLDEALATERKIKKKMAELGPQLSTTQKAEIQAGVRGIIEASPRGQAILAALKRKLR